MKPKTLSPELLRQMDAYWRAANYLSVGQIYLYDNPLLKRPLALADVKHVLLGHWGTTPGQNFIYVHLNRVIKKYDLDMIYVSGPGHGGPAKNLSDEDRATIIQIARNALARFQLRPELKEKS
jgi:xylulose-5-phosphate/fructose-6-phosphate phosphoketolase